MSRGSGFGSLAGFLCNWTSLPPRSKKTLSIADFISWIPRPCSALGFSRAKNGFRIEPLSLVRNGETKSLSKPAPAAHVNQLSRIHPVSVDHRVAYRFPKRQLDFIFRAGNAMRLRNERHQAIHKRRNGFDLATYPTIGFE
jgi:hypothetical protein